MSAETALGVTAAVYGGVGAIAPTLQWQRMATQRSSEDVSVLYLMLYGIGHGIWLAYGISIESVPLMVVDSIGLLVSAFVFERALHYGRRGPWRTRRAVLRGTVRSELRNLKATVRGARRAPATTDERRR